MTEKISFRVERPAFFYFFLSSKGLVENPPLDDLLLGELERRSRKLNVHASHLVSDLDRLGDRLAERARAEEPSRERVTGTVRVDDRLLRERLDGVRLGLVRLGRRNDGRRGTLGDDDDARRSSVRLGRRCELLGDLGNVLGLLRSQPVSG